MGIAAILINGAKPFEQIVNTLATESPYMKFGENCSSGFREEDIKNKLATVVAILDFWSAKS